MGPTIQIPLFKVSSYLVVDRQWSTISHKKWHVSGTKITHLSLNMQKMIGLLNSYIVRWYRDVIVVVNKHCKKENL